MADAQREGWRWLLVGVLPGVLLCAARLRLDLWYDEVYTLYHFAARPAAEIVTDYSAPNNHILFTLMLRPVYLVALGSGAWWLLRWLPLLVSVGTLLLAYRLARRLGGWPVAVVATWLLGLCQMFLIHTMQLRGYGLSMLLLVWLADWAVAAGTRGETVSRDEASPARSARQWRPMAAVAIGGAAFLYVVPTNLLFLLALMLAVGIRTAWVARPVGRRAWQAVAPWLAAVALAAICYAPVAGELLALRRGGGDNSGAVVTKAGRAMVGFYRAALYDAWPLAGIALVYGAGALAIEARAAWRGRRSSRRDGASSSSRHRSAHRAASDRGSTGNAPAERASTKRGSTTRASSGHVATGRSAAGRMAAPIGENIETPAAADWSGHRGAMGGAAFVLGAALIGPFLIAAVLGTVPFVRNFSPALPLLAVALGGLLYGAAAAAARWTVGRDVPAPVVAIGCLLLIGLVIGPRLASYGNRLIEARRKGRVQDGYYNYYAARFEPSRAVAFVRDDVADGRPYELCYFVEDHYNLLHALATAALPVRRPLEQQREKSAVGRWRYFFDTDSPPRTPERTCHNAPQAWQRAPVVAEFGFFRVRRLPPLPAGAVSNTVEPRANDAPHHSVVPQSE